MPFKSNRQQIEKAITEGLFRNMRRAAGFLERKVKRSLSRGQPRAKVGRNYSTGVDPSSPGQPPKAFRGTLRKSIVRSVFFTKDSLVGKVGTAIPYARSLELGRPGGGRIIRPRRAKVLIMPLRRRRSSGVSVPLLARAKKRAGKAKWIFRQSARMGTIRKRPFMRKALEDNAPQLMKLIGAPIRIQVK